MGARSHPTKYSSTSAASSCQRLASVMLPWDAQGDRRTVRPHRRALPAIQRLAILHLTPSMKSYQSSQSAKGSRRGSRNRSGRAIRALRRSNGTRGANRAPATDSVAKDTFAFFTGSKKPADNRQRASDPLPPRRVRSADDGGSLTRQTVFVQGEGRIGPQTRGGGSHHPAFVRRQPLVRRNRE